MTGDALADLNRKVQYDMVISVNDDLKFAMSDPSCAFVEAREDGASHFSSVTVLVHEILHGMGMFSIGINPHFLANATRLNTVGTTWDNLMHDPSGAPFVPVDSCRATRMLPVLGEDVRIEGVEVYVHSLGNRVPRSLISPKWPAPRP